MYMIYAVIQVWTLCGDENSPSKPSTTLAYQLMIGHKSVMPVFVKLRIYICIYKLLATLAMELCRCHDCNFDASIYV